MNRAFFPDKTANMKLVTELKNFEATVNSKVEKQKSEKGDFKDNYSGVVMSNLPEAFTLSLIHIYSVTAVLDVNGEEVALTQSSVRVRVRATSSPFTSKTAVTECYNLSIGFPSGPTVLTVNAPFPLSVRSLLSLSLIHIFHTVTAHLPTVRSIVIYPRLRVYVVTSFLAIRRNLDVYKRQVVYSLLLQ